MEQSNKISVLVADDEQLARRLISSLVNKDPALRLIASCASGDEARREINRLQPDLAFLDIQMPGLSGVELVESLSRQEHAPYVVFVTAFDRYAVKAFEMDALDYVLKPIEPNRFRKATERAKEAIRQKRIGSLSRQIARISAVFGEAPREEPRRLVVRKGDELVQLRLGDIVWVEAASQYVHVHTQDHSYTLSKSLKAFMQELPPDRFTRVHRSAVVNRSRLKRILKRPNGVHDLVLEDGTHVPVSRSRKQLVPELIRDCAAHSGT